jgi:ATP-dependent protease HslVU (ClpYQ) peptidase subunit
VPGDVQLDTPSMIVSDKKARIGKARWFFFMGKCITKNSYTQNSQRNTKDPLLLFSGKTADASRLFEKQANSTQELLLRFHDLLAVQNRI